MTLVFRSELGYLQQTQIGPPDIVATFSAAQAAWGWIGGLDGVQRFLKSLSLSISQLFSENSGFQIPSTLELLPLVGQVFTESGPVPYTIESDPGIFGDGLPSKLIGLSVCAIAHECGGSQAVHLFMKCMAPALFPKPLEANDALHGILMDNWPKIVSEGASRGLTTLFSNAINNLNLPSSDRRWLQDSLSSTTKAFPPEISMVGGLLKWLSTENRSTYFTRSSLVARVASCLKEIGYLINGIETWNGTDCRPKTSGSRVVLVLGGSSETDTHMLSDDEQIPGYPFLHHYSFRTVGAMLTNSAYDQSGISIESFQNIFEDIYQGIDERLTVKWSAVPFAESTESVAPIRVTLTWKPGKSQLLNRSIATRIASMNFPTLAEKIAFCYEGVVDNEHALQEILSFKKHKPLKTSSNSIMLFRAATASIIIAMAAKLSGDTFKDCQHLTRLRLTTDDWIKPMCNCLDGSANYLSLKQAVILLAAVHTGAEPIAFQSQDSRIIGWRDGIYAVLPSLLIEMRPATEAVGLRCIDSFWGNCLAYEDGSIKAGNGSGIIEDTSILEEAEQIMSSDVQSLRGPHLGPPIPGPPDVPLYLTIERPLHYNSRDLSLRGRIAGNPVGTVGVIQILQVLLHSLEQSPCTGRHLATNVVFNIKPSVWTKRDNYKPVGGKFNSFIPVKEDSSWALFLAGQTESYNGRIVFGCPQCAGDSVEIGSALIGYT
jgi:hypothetical protein